MRQIRDSSLRLSHEDAAVIQDVLLETGVIRGSLVDGWGSVDAWTFAKAAKKQPGLWAMLNLEDAAGTFEMLKRLGHGDALAKIEWRIWAYDEDPTLAILLSVPGVEFSAGSMSATAVVSDKGGGEFMRCRFDYKRYRRSDAIPYYFDTMVYIAEHMTELFIGRAAVIDYATDPARDAAGRWTLADSLRYFTEEAGNVELLRTGPTMELGAQRTPSIFYVERNSFSRFNLQQYAAQATTKMLADAAFSDYTPSYRQTYNAGYAIVALANVMDAISASAEELPR
jgi:hypothetical protein